MAKLTPKDIRTQILRILKKIPANRGERSYVTAYQIFERLPVKIKERIINERGRFGKGSGHYYAAASVVARAAMGVSEIACLETSNIEIRYKNESLVRPGNRNVGLYRLVNNEH